MKLFSKTNETNGFYKTDNLSLEQLANQFETDKGTADPKTLSWGVDFPLHQCMHYTDTYEKYMQDKKYESVNMLEIGVCDKRFPYASIKMWMSYFKNLNLYAVDNFWGHSLDDKLQDISELQEAGVNFIYADQGSFTDWDELNKLFPNYFDFLVEDGSHWPNHMMISLWKSIGIIKQGGYFFMEDIQNPLKSRGWFKYDNSLIAQELLETLSTKKLYSSFLNDQQNKDIDDNFELVDLVLDPKGINYLAIFKRK
jgi:hypothetical protein